MKEFKASQPFIDSCTVYYGHRFENCLKQVKSIYLHLDLSKVTIESESNPKDDSVVLAQPTVDPPVIPLVPSTEPLNVENPLAQDVQDKDDKNPPDTPASLFSTS